LASVGQLESLWYINASTAQSEQELQASFALMDRKPSKRLLDLYDEYQAYVQRQGSAAGFRPSHSGLHVGNGLVTIQAAPTKDGSILLKDLEALGLQHGAASRWSVSGLFPIAALGSVDKLESLGYMRESIAFTN
jgi:hypothetical protein